jgi:hypothetical protein
MATNYKSHIEIRLVNTFYFQGQIASTPFPEMSTPDAADTITYLSVTRQFIGAEAFLKSSWSLSWLRKFPLSMEPETLPPCSQEPPLFLSQINLIDSLQHCLLKIHLILSFHLCLGFPSGLFQNQNPLRIPKSHASYTSTPPHRL